MVPTWVLVHPRQMSGMQTNFIETVILKLNHLCLVLPINLKKENTLTIWLFQALKWVFQI
jgi:hypothetical protein